jgi:hypothetical protein
MYDIPHTTHHIPYTAYHIIHTIYTKKLIFKHNRYKPLTYRNYNKIKMSEKKVTRNALTEKAELEFNVNSVRKHMISFCQNSDLYFESKNEDGTIGKKLPILKLSHVGLSAVLQKLTASLAQNALLHTPTNSVGLKTVNVTKLQYSICLHDGYNKYFANHLKAFNENQVYKDQLPITVDEIKRVINKVDDKLDFNPKAFNLLSYFVLTVYLDVLKTSFDFVSFSGKRTLSHKAISASVTNRFNSQLASELCSELNRACSAVADANADVAADDDADNDDADADDNDGADDVDEEPAPTKKATGKKQVVVKKATGTNKTAPIAQADDADDDDMIDDEEGDGEDDDEEEEEEVVVEAKKPAPKKVVAKQAAVKQAVVKKASVTRKATK